MRINKKLLVALLALAASSTQAAEKNFNVKYRFAIMEDGGLIHEIRRQNYGFRVEIVNDAEGVKSEGSKNGYPFVTASKGERYSVRLTNPLPVRVAVNLTVDGLNSITGKPSGIADGEKWMIDPYSSITIPGWQVNGGKPVVSFSRINPNPTRSGGGTSWRRTWRPTAGSSARPFSGTRGNSTSITMITPSTVIPKTPCLIPPRPVPKPRSG